MSSTPSSTGGSAKRRRQQRIVGFEEHGDLATDAVQPVDHHHVVGRADAAAHLDHGPGDPLETARVELLAECARAHLDVGRRPDREDPVVVGIEALDVEGGGRFLDDVAELLAQAGGRLCGRDAVRMHRGAAERLRGERDAQAAGRRAHLLEERARGWRREVGSPGAGPAVASSAAALSRTLRETTCSTEQPARLSPAYGASVLRLRVVFMPNRPQQDAGMRIEPPPSLAWASGTMRAATAAAEPPLEPPAVRVGSHGLRVGPNSTGSVVALSPNSGVLVRPRIISPARLCRFTISASAGAGAWAKKREPADSGTPA